MAELDEAIRHAAGRPQAGLITRHGLPQEIIPALASQLGHAMRTSIPQRAYQVLLGDDGALYWLSRDASGATTRYDTEPGASVWKRMGVAILSVLPIDWLL